MIYEPLFSPHSAEETQYKAKEFLLLVSFFPNAMC